MEKCKNGGKPWVGEPLYASPDLGIWISITDHLSTSLSAASKVRAMLCHAVLR